MGTAVLANSAYPLNRQRLAERLDFDGVHENSLDSSQVSTYDIPIEAANLASSSAIRVGAMIGDIHTQYHQIRPWLLLDEEATYTSSAMPQERNPGLLMRNSTTPLGALKDERFILARHPGAPGMYANLIKACQNADFEPTIAFEVERMLTNVSLVAAGEGISVVPASELGAVYRKG